MKKDYITLSEIKKEVDNLVDYRINLKHLYASSGKRKLFITGYGGFIVENDGVVICETLQPFIAIDNFYNY